MLEHLQGNGWKISLIIIVTVSTFFFIKKSIQMYKRLTNKRLLIHSGIRDIDRMDGFLFEEYLKYLFKALGYRPQVTKKSGDFGADLVLKGKSKIVVQAKRYGYKNNVSLDAVREVYASQAYYKADEAWVITNSFFTKQAKELAQACNVKLLGRKELQKFIYKINPKEKPKEFIEHRGSMSS